MDVPTLGQLMDPRRRDLWRLSEVKLLERFHPWQLRFQDPPSDSVALTFLNLGLQQRFQIANRSILLLQGFFRHPAKLRTDGWKP